MLLRILVMLNLTLLLLGNGYKMNKAAEELLSTQSSIELLQAEFILSVTRDDKKEKVSETVGEVYLTKGKKYRVEYFEPTRQLLVSDGFKQWLYLEEINQVQEQAVNYTNNIFLLLGGHLKDFIPKCEVKKINESSEEVQYTLVPKEKNTLVFDRVTITLVGKTRIPKTIRLEGAQTTEINFKKVKINVWPDKSRKNKQEWLDSFFTFVPPSDAEVIKF